PDWGHIRQIDISHQAVTKTMQKFLDTRHRLDQTLETTMFPATPSPLCGWCEVARSCPSANIHKTNAIENAAKQPSVVELNIPGSREEDPRIVAEADKQRHKN